MSTGTTNPQFTRHVDALYGDSLENLFATGDEVETLLQHPGFAKVMAVIDRERESVDHALDSGERPLEQAEYALKHGRRGALGAFGEAADAIVGRAHKRHVEQAEKHEGGAESSPGR